jgi:hypothetical protein
MKNETVISYRPLRQRKAQVSDAAVSMFETAGIVLVTLAFLTFIIGAAIASSS